MSEKLDLRPTSRIDPFVPVDLYAMVHAESYAEIAVIAAMNYHGWKNGENWPGVPRIARLAKMSLRTCQDTLKGLLAKGWLERKRRFSNSSVYKKKIPVMQWAEAFDALMEQEEVKSAKVAELTESAESAGYIGKLRHLTSNGIIEGEKSRANHIIAPMAQKEWKETYPKTCPEDSRAFCTTWNTGGYCTVEGVTKRFKGYGQVYPWMAKDSVFWKQMRDSLGPERLKAVYEEFLGSKYFGPPMTNMKHPVYKMYQHVSRFLEEKKKPIEKREPKPAITMPHNPNDPAFKMLEEGKSLKEILEKLTGRRIYPQQGGSDART